MLLSEKQKKYPWKAQRYENEINFGQIDFDCIQDINFQQRAAHVSLNRRSEIRLQMNICETSVCRQ